MTIKDLKQLQELLGLFINTECLNYIDIDDCELIYTLNRIYNIIEEKKQGKNNLPISTTTNR